MQATSLGNRQLPLKRQPTTHRMAARVAVRLQLRRRIKAPLLERLPLEAAGTARPEVS